MTLFTNKQRCMSCLIAALLGAFAFTSAAHAQSDGATVTSERHKLINAPNAVSTVGPDMFGDNVNIYTGSLGFAQTDVSIPGNNNLRVAAGRTLATGSRGNLGLGLFAHWELDIPKIHGTFSERDGWRRIAANGQPSTARCTNFGAPPAVYKYVDDATKFRPSEFWHGNMLYIPGGGSQEIVTRLASNTNVPLDGVATPLVTKDFWAIRCLGTLASTNWATSANEGGEGFLAISPDGTHYRFDWLVSRKAEKMTKPVRDRTTGLGTGGGDPFSMTGRIMDWTNGFGKGSSFSIERREVMIYPTLVTDRFGNTVRYTYDPADKARLLSIKSADGAGNAERTLTFTYHPTERLIQTVSDGTRTWTYGYSAGPAGETMLTSVTLPDNSAWNFAGMQPATGYGLVMTDRLLYNGFESNESPDMSPDPQPTGLYSEPISGSMMHPSGATATFTLSPIQHARNGVPINGYSDGVGFARVYESMWYDMYSLTAKTIRGPGLGDMTWTTTYDTFNPGNECTDCGPFEPNRVSVTDPKGDVTRYSFGSTFGVDEGMPLQVDIGWTGSSALRTTKTRYNTSFTARIGYSDKPFADMQTGNRHIPADQRVITQQGVDFTWQVPGNLDFDEYARPLRVTKSNTLGNTRTESTTYRHDKVKWVLGQVEKVTEASTGLVPVLNTYNATNSNLETVTRFGGLASTMSYNPDGTLASVKDAKNQVTGYASYKRGIPRTITYADSSTETVVVNDIGKVTSRTDQNGYLTRYGHDSIGRVASITPPIDDTVSWNPTTVAFEQIANSEFDLASGHWRQTVTTGTAKVIKYFDAMWRPVYAYKADLNNPTSTSSIVKTDYDFNGSAVSASFPQRDYASLAGGVRTEYDALGRTVSVDMDSEHGVITSTNAYASGFRTISTNGRGFNTTSTFQAFDEPVESAIATISAPLDVSVSIARNILGKPISITRSGGGKSATRTYVYDSQQRLCKTIEPETGATVQDYDLADNVAWRASGLNLPMTNTCDTTNVAVSSAKKIAYVYDPLNRLKTTSYGDSSPEITRSYWPDGLPKTVNSAGVNWTYTYNRRRLLTDESMVYGGTNYSLRKAYDSNGSLSQLIYPDNSAISYSPNAFGEPTQVGAFASGISYYPNGALKRFRYGNGVTHTLTQNVRGLPDRSTDKGVLSDGYVFDKNANVTAIGDWQEGVSSRVMEYDELDRLKRVAAPALWGDALYSYDSLDNLTQSQFTGGNGIARTMVHNYPDSATNRLVSVTGTANFAVGYGYDSQGNITQRGNQRYVFDLGNRMKEATGKATYLYDGLGRRTSTIESDGANRMQMYAQDGKLVYTGPTNAPKTKYIYLDKHVIAEVGDLGTLYIHTDGLGSPVARTTTSCGLVSRTRYEPYGRTALGAEPTLGFTGHANDHATGLTYMEQRYYDPLAGRFLSIDPVTTDANTGLSFNRYVYANNSPYKYIDPDGRFFVILIPFIPYIATATIAVVGHFALPGRQGREDTAKAVGNAIFSNSKSAPGTVGSDKGCIYLCDGVSPGQRTPSGRPYVGSADDKDKRAKGARDGRERKEAKTIGEYDKGDSEGRGNAEQNGMNEQGGKGQLDNRRDEVSEKKWGDRGIKPPEEKKSE
ncbi:MAG: RHS repeat-associated core domain-containing protein [Pseudomonadota bacterium]